MAIAWSERGTGKRIELFADSDARSWDELTADLRPALVRLFTEMAARLEADVRYALLISLWHDSGRIILQAHRRGRSVGSARVAMQVICQYIAEAQETHMADAPDDDSDRARRFAYAFDATVALALGAACRAAEVRAAWGCVLERVANCIEYIQVADEEESRREAFMLLPPDDD
jgi:hypothetical protein